MTIDHEDRFGHRSDDRLDALLRTLDPAADDLDADARWRADALLERITAAPPDAASRRRRSRARWYAVGAAAAAFAVAAATLPSLWPSTPAYATWTPEPTPVTGSAREQAVDACRTAMADSGGRLPDPQPAPMADSARTVLAEQRGEVILVSLIAANDSSFTCTFDAKRPNRLATAGGGIATADTPDRAPLTSDGLRSLGVGMFGGPTESFAHVSGRVGDAVRTVTIRTSTVTFAASVSDGVFAAWWPIGPMGVEPVILDVRYDVTLADGTVLTDVDDGMARGPRPGPGQIGRVERGGGIGPDGEVGTAGGLVGSDVVGVTVHADGRDTDAEVSNGTFRASWPLADGGAESQAGSGPTETTYTLTLRDGTVLTDQRPVSGSGS